VCVQMYVCADVCVYADVSVQTFYCDSHVLLWQPVCVCVCVCVCACVCVQV